MEYPEAQETYSKIVASIRSRYGHLPQNASMQFQSWDEIRHNMSHPNRFTMTVYGVGQYAHPFLDQSDVNAIICRMVTDTIRSNAEARKKGMTGDTMHVQITVECNPDWTRRVVLRLTNLFVAALYYFALACAVLFCIYGVVSMAVRIGTPSFLTDNAITRWIRATWDWIVEEWELLLQKRSEASDVKNRKEEYRKSTAKEDEVRKGSVKKDEGPFKSDEGDSLIHSNDK